MVTTRYLQKKRRDLIEDSCAIVYTDIVSDVRPILCELRSSGLKCAGYYGEMDPDERQVTQDEWIQNNVQVMVVTNAFVLRIDNSYFCHVIKNGVPLNISVHGFKGLVGQVEMEI